MQDQSGHKEGIKETTIQMVKEMEKNGIPVETIIKITKLPKKEVEKILQEVKK